MADEIFTPDELKADQADPQTPPPEETEEQKADRERDEQGRFKAKEPDEAQEAGADEPKEKGGTVPQQALHAEREKRKAAEGELSKIREQLDALAKMREQVAARKPEALPPADDPAAVEHLRTRLAELEGNTTRIANRMDTDAINNAELQQLGSVMSQSEADYRAEKPDYDEAINHVVQARAQELAYYGMTQQQIAQTISQEATDIVRSAIAQGRNPAEMGYQIALTRGYRPKEPAPQQEQPGNGAQAVLDAIAKAKQQGKSLGAGGGGKAATLNAEAVLAMGPEEFAQVYSTPEGKAMIDSL